jgi:hypothetical protein
MVSWIALTIMAGGALAFIGLIRTAVRWGNELIELQQFGVETTGTVLRKRSYKAKGAQSRSVKYEYRDQFGTAHTRKMLVTGDAWEALQEGGPIAIVYSQRRPKVSAPKYLLDVMKNAKARITINGRE